MPSSEHDALVEMIQSAPPGEGSLEESRANFDAMMAASPLPEDISVDTFNIGDMEVDWVRAPNSRDERVVLYLHGGGYVIGNNVGYRELASRVARAASARVLLIDYRLAPENPFPAAVDDATAAYRWLLNEGIDASQIAVAGDSAGGGLTLATLVALRDAGDPLPKCATCFSPWVDLEMSGVIDDPMLTVDVLEGMAENYAGSDRRNPLVAPLHANLDGLPPLQIFVGTREILKDDAIRLVDNAGAAGVDTSLSVGEGLIHVWQLFGHVPESIASLEAVQVFMDKHLPA